MKYYVIKIEKLNNEWKVYGYQDDLDREETETHPQSIGVFWVHTAKDKQEAYQELKKSLITTYEKTINSLNESLNGLKNLQFSETVKETE